MYERHFGIAGPPFHLSPDPYFYFDSTQHCAVLDALKQAFARELAFIVLSGEIGAGKTTVLRAWSSELESSGIAVGQIVNTQLDASELMIAIAYAFGIRLHVGSSDDDAMRDLVRDLKQRAAALLIIDEAQNLSGAALQQLVALADMASEEGALLRICLAGQPELRARVQEGDLASLQSRVQLSCHLGPLDAEQTRKYIEHRLTKVGWSGTPSFDATAFGKIHRFTGGIPRRVNVLSNRLMLSQFLNGTARIDARAVVATAHALRAEMGEPEFTQAPPVSAPSLRKSEVLERGSILLLTCGRSDHIKAVPLLLAMAKRGDLPQASLASVSPGGAWRLDRDLHAFAGLTQQPIALVDEAETSLDEIESAFEQFLDSSLPRAVVLFDGDEVTLRCASAAHDFGVPLVHIGTNAQAAGEFDDPRSARAAIGRFADLRFNCQPIRADGMASDESLRVFGDPAFSTPLAAPAPFEPASTTLEPARTWFTLAHTPFALSLSKCPRIQGLFTVGRGFDRLSPNGSVCAETTPSTCAEPTLSKCAEPPSPFALSLSKCSRIQSKSINVGNLLIDAVQLALQFAERTPREAKRWSPPPQFIHEQRGYGVIALKQRPAESHAARWPDLIPLLSDVSRDLPLVWPLHRDTMLAMRDKGFTRNFASNRIACIEELGHADFIRLVRDASCVFTDSLDVIEEALALDVPCLSLGVSHAGMGEWCPALDVGSSATKATRALWGILFNGADLNVPPVLWDGHAAERMVAHLARWLVDLRQSTDPMAIDAAAQPPG